MTAQPQQTYDANAVLMGGGGSAAWKFEQPVTKTGTVKSPPQARQERDYDPNNPRGGDLKFFPSGDPIMGVQVEVQTTERDPSQPEDDGVRTFYIEGRYLREAVREGVRNAGAPGLQVGGVLVVEFTHREDPMDKRSRKYWRVTYTPPGNAALMADVSPAPAAAAPAPTAQVATPSVQPAAPTAQAAPAPAAAPPGMTPESFAAYQAWQASQQQPA